MIENSESKDLGAKDKTVKPEADISQRAKSLAEFMSLKTVKASQFISDINASVVVIGRGDLEDIASLVSKKPALLPKIVELVRSAIARSGNAQDICMRIALVAIQAQDRELGEWPGNESSDASFGRLAAWARLRLKGRDPEFRQKGENVLALGLLYLLATRVLDPVNVLRELASAYGFSGMSDRADVARDITRLLRKARPNQLSQFARIAELQDAAVREAERQIQSEQQKLATARAKIEDLGARVHLLEAELAKARQAIEAEREVSAGLRQQLESALRLGAHGMGDLRARYRRVFQEEIGPITTDAIDALEIGKSDFAKNYVEQLKRRVDKEVEWLNSSSE